MNIMELEKQFGIVPIVETNTSIVLGRLVWDSPFTKPVFTRTYGSMYTHLLNALFDAGLIKIDFLEQKLNEFKNIEKSPSAIIIPEISGEGHFIADFKHPLINTANAEIGYKFIKSFSFSNIQVRILDNKNRIIISDLIEDLKKDNWQKYEDNVRYVHLVTALYYGDMSFTITNSVEAKAAFQAIINGADINPNISFETEKTVKYTFSNNELPFGMKIERLKFFKP